MFGELVPQGGGDPIPLLKKKLMVGRRGCDIDLPFANVSSRHCELEMQEGYWLVRDLGSSNGTKVNGIRVRSKWVMPGDELAVARHRYTIDYEVAANAPPPPPLAEDAEENIMGMSLMEKAGLVRRRQPDTPPPRPASRPAPNGKPGEPVTEDDRALEWLQDDENNAE